MKTFKYDIIQNGKRIRNIKKIENHSEGVLLVIEKNYMMGDYWWLHIIIFDIILGFIGSTYIENKLEPLQRFELEYKDLNPDQFHIIIKEEDINIYGVREYNIKNLVKEIPFLMKKRAENKKKIIIILSINILVILFAIIILISLFN